MECRQEASGASGADQRNGLSLERLGSGVQELFWTCESCGKRRNTASCNCRTRPQRRCSTRRATVGAACSCVVPEGQRWIRWTTMNQKETLSVMMVERWDPSVRSRTAALLLELLQFDFTGRSGAAGDKRETCFAVHCSCLSPHPHVTGHDQVLIMKIYNMVERIIEVYMLVEFYFVFSHVPTVATCTCKSGLDEIVFPIRRFDLRVTRLILYIHAESVFVEIAGPLPALIKQGVRLGCGHLMSLALVMGHHV